MLSSDAQKLKEAEKQEKIKKATRMIDESKNPCIKEQKLSLKCLNDNNYQKDACTTSFINYRNCRDFWDSVQSDRRRKGIRPLLPPPEEREALKSSYLSKTSPTLS